MGWVRHLDYLHLVPIMTALLSYSTDSPAQTELPFAPKPSALSSKIKSIALWVVLAGTILCSFLFGLSLNAELGLVLTALALPPLVALVAISLFFAPRSEVSIPLRFIALIWGGVGATNLTLFVVDIISAFFGTPSQTVTVTVQAAIVEEACKALFLFSLFYWYKHLIRTPLAGAMLGLLVGAGFAFVENIMYFNNAYLQGGWDALWTTFILRAGLSFFLHPMATMFTGLFLGYVVSKRTQLNFLKEFIFIEMGFLAAMTIHGLWNGMASITTVGSKWNLMYLCFWVPMFVLISVTLYIVRRNYLTSKKALLLTSTRLGYIKMDQAERMIDKAARKALYKTSNSTEIIQWESSIMKIQHWNDSLAVVKREKRARKLSKAKSKDMMKLAAVVSKV